MDVSTTVAAAAALLKVFSSHPAFAHALTIFSLFFQRENLYKEVLYTITHKLGHGGNRGGGGENLAHQLIQLQKKPAALSAALAPLWQTVTNVGGGEPDKQPMSKEELLIYAQEAFDIDDENHHKLMGEVKEEKVEFLASIIIAYC